MALGISDSKGGINKNKGIVSDNSVILFKEITKINKLGANDGCRVLGK